MGAATPRFTTAYWKTSIINLYAMGMNFSKIQDLTGKSIEYIDKVVEEYVCDGTITCNSRMNRIKE